MRSILVATAFCFFIPAVAMADWTWRSGDSSARFYGWSVWKGNRDLDTTHFQFASTRLRLDADSDKWKFFLELEAVNADHKNADWLKQADATYRVSERLGVTVGRIFQDTGAITPSSRDLETASYPRTPFRLYAYGGKVTWSLRENLTIVGGLTSASEAAFHSSESWDHAEAFARLKFQWHALIYDAYVLVGDNLGVYGLKVEYGHGPIKLKAATWSNNQGDLDNTGSFLFGAYKPWPWLELHTQYDYVSDADSRWARGVRLLPFKGKLAVIVDYETSSENNRWLSRIVLRF